MRFSPLGLVHAATGDSQEDRGCSKRGIGTNENFCAEARTPLEDKQSKYPLSNNAENSKEVKELGISKTQHDVVQKQPEKQDAVQQQQQHQQQQELPLPRVVPSRPLELDRGVAGSFKVARSSVNAKAMAKQWCNRALDMGVPGLIEEFKVSLARWKPENMTCDAFLANRDKNRYLDVPCQDARRVIVNWPGLPNDYIHANYVANPTKDDRFICAQGPLDNTQLAFWAMVIQVKSEAIIMLCNNIEQGKFKCSQYFPREKGETMTFGEGPGKIVVTNLDVHPMSEEDNFVRICRLKIDYQKDGKEESSTVRHIQWENWPDRGVPPTKLTATNILSEVRGTTKPIIVHCSAGIGRTGTIVAIAYVQEKMQHGKNCMDMNALTKELRTQRPYSIQNEYQYVYVHRVLLAYFLEKYRDRFQNILAGEGEAKYAKWREEYKAFTGCD